MADPTPLHVSIVATSDAQVSPLSGIFETLNGFGLLVNFEPDVPARPFEVEVVAEGLSLGGGSNGLSLNVDRTIAQVERTDIVIVPLMMVEGVDWVCGRSPELVEWMRRMHEQGAMLCSACTGVLLLAETGLLDGLEATIHWAFAPTFERNFPKVRLRTREVLVTAGERGEFVMTGGVTSWHDLVLHLIARHVGPTAAHAMGRLMMLQWHSEGQAPFVGFVPPRSHGDALILELQAWLDDNLAVAGAVEEMVARSGLSRRGLERRFRKATGHSPNAYIQALRIEEAKRRLERSIEPVEEIGYQVGYENAAFFRRIFKRATRMTPGAYRRRFQSPWLASAG